MLWWCVSPGGNGIVTKDSLLVATESMLHLMRKISYDVWLLSAIRRRTGDTL